jgi:two-component system chemotaxis response regulator CheB
MPKRDLVTIGGSAGSFEVLEEIVETLPADLAACVMVVVHLALRDKGTLPSILASRSHRDVRWAENGSPIEAGRIYVAPADRHLVVADDHIHIDRGPKEGLQRPSINVTFRSAAAHYGPRVIGVLLSGMLDDGAAGLWEIANRGGVTIVQDPGDARYPSMPRNAIQDAVVNYQVKAREIGPLIARLVSGEEEPKLLGTNGAGGAMGGVGVLSCPECDGPLVEMQKPGPIEFRCRVGHVMPLKTLLEEATSSQERKLYQAMLAMLEGADLAEFAATHGKDADREALHKEAAQLRRHAEAIKRIIEERIAPDLD